MTDNAARHTATDLDALIERVEAAGGPDTEIDRDIMLSVGYIYEQRNIGCRHEDGSVALDWVYVDARTDQWRSTHPFKFTASIDAAMTLVPEGMIWMLTNSGIDHPTKPDFTRATAVVDRWQSTAPMKECSAATPALALLDAALRARKEQEA